MSPKDWRVQLLPACSKPKATAGLPHSCNKKNIKLKQNQKPFELNYICGEQSLRLLFLIMSFSGRDSSPYGRRVCSSPEPGTWDISSRLWERRGGEGLDRRCDSCRRSRRTTTGGPQQSHCHIPGTCTGPPELDGTISLCSVICDTTNEINVNTEQHTYFTLGRFDQII